MSKSKPPGSLGERISLEFAEELIQEHKALEKITTRIVNENADPLMRVKAIEMNGKNYNAFVFSKDLIMRFFDGSETDKFDNPQSSNFLLVILGAHPKEVGDFKAGSFTVLTAGCVRKVEKVIVEGEEKEVTKFYPLDIDYPANEYPPQSVITSLVSDKDGNKTIEYFLSVE